MNEDPETSALAQRLDRLELTTRILLVLAVLLFAGLGVLLLRSSRGGVGRSTDRLVIRTADGDTAAFFGLDSLPGEGGKVEEGILRVAHAEIGRNWGQSRVTIGTGSEGGIGLTVLDYEGKLRASLIVSDEGNEASFQLYDTSGATTFSTPLPAEHQSQGSTTIEQETKP
jgi:hypothetical protein